MENRRIPQRGKVHYYYSCRQHRVGVGDCPHATNHQAEELEGRVWEFVSQMLQHPEHLREGLDELIRQEQEATRGDPVEHQKR